MAAPRNSNSCSIRLAPELMVRSACGKWAAKATRLVLPTTMASLLAKFTDKGLADCSTVARALATAWAGPAECRYPNRKRKTQQGRPEEQWQVAGDQPQKPKAPVGPLTERQCWNPGCWLQIAAGWAIGVTKMPKGWKIWWTSCKTTPTHARRVTAGEATSTWAGQK